MLHTLGLSASEQAVYEVLVTQPPLSVERIAELVDDGPWAGQAGRVLQRLEQLGLVARLPGDPPRHAVVPVDVALEALIAARERSLAAVRQRVDTLTARFGTARVGQDPLDLVEVVTGQDAVHDRLADLIRGVRSEMVAFDAPPYLSAPTWNHRADEVVALREGVRFRVIYDRRAVDRPGRIAELEESVVAGEEVRVTDLPMKLGIGDGRLAMLPLSIDPVDLDCWLVVHESVLVEALSAFFEVYWQRAVPLRVARSRPELVGADGPTEIERDLLPLLVAGLTDREIAGHLGWHERTAHRHLRTMMTRLDAVTRFQAGYQAVRRGWLTGSGSHDG